jgi:hypothetical protein
VKATPFFKRLWASEATPFAKRLWPGHDDNRPTAKRRSLRADWNLTVDRIDHATTKSERPLSLERVAQKPTPLPVTSEAAQ